MKLIPQLKQEHVEILRSFDSIKEGVSKWDAGDGKLLDQLRELKDILVAHLDLEDKLLYSALERSDVPNVKNLSKKYSAEMLDISKVVMAFFNKYMKKTISDLLESAEFRIELNGIIKAISRRVEAEENVLYPVYEECCEAKE